MGKLRILGLHGYHGSAAALRAQMRGWSEGLEDVADFVVVDAPALAEGDFGWWHVREGRCLGWTRTRDFIAAFCAREGGFDGVFGFSQGAALAALLAGSSGFDFGFAVLVGGFMTRDEDHAPCYEALDEVPSLHVIGRSDGVVPAPASLALAGCFRAPVVLEHAGGHVVGATPAIREASREFLAARLTARP